MHITNTNSAHTTHEIVKLASYFANCALSEITIHFNGQLTALLE